MQELYSLAQAARMLECAPHRISYLLSTRAVPEPKVKVAGRRLWTLEEIAVIAEALRVQVAKQLERQRRSHD